METRSPDGTENAEAREQKNPLERRSGLGYRLVVERYVSIDWTRHRVREKQCSLRFAPPAPHFIGEARTSKGGAIV
jgi:hypothetical protein